MMTHHIGTLHVLKEVPHLECAGRAPTCRDGEGALDYNPTVGIRSARLRFDPKRRRRFALPAHSIKFAIVRLVSLYNEG